LNAITERAAGDAAPAPRGGGDAPMPHTPVPRRA